MNQNKSDYLGEVAAALGFLEEDARRDILTDIEELYDGLQAQGMSSSEVEKQIGSPQQVAREYRGGVDDAPHSSWRQHGGSEGDRTDTRKTESGATVSRRVVRAFAACGLGVVWFCLGVLAMCAAITVAAGSALALGAAIGVHPIVTTLAVPGIPAAGGAFMGIAVVLLGIALFMLAGFGMRVCSTYVRRENTGPNARAECTLRRRRDRLVRRLRITLIGAAVASGLAAAAWLIIPAQVFVVEIDHDNEYDLTDVSHLRVVTESVDVVFSVGGERVTARLAGEVRETVAQYARLRSDVVGSRATVVPVYREGLSWGINRPPILYIELPDDAASKLRRIDVIADTADVDTSALPTELDRLVSVTSLSEAD